MNKLAFIDIGELGWSLILSAYIRWLKKNTDSMVTVISFPGRKCLYEGIADDVINVPGVFNKKYNLQFQDCFRLRHVGWDELKDFFSSQVPEGYHIPEYREYPLYIFSSHRIYEPYKYSKPSGDGKEIMVFPRYRAGVRRNLPEKFYSSLIERLCNEFPKLTVRTSGTKNGAYDIKIDKPNYINWIDKESGGLQDLIDSCQSAIAAVGGVSAPPKISLLQGVPTFIIGDQQTRHMQEDNRMNAKIGFYRIGKKEYSKFNFDECIEKAVAFVRESNE